MVFAPWGMVVLLLIDPAEKPPLVKKRHFFNTTKTWRSVRKRRAYRILERKIFGKFCAEPREF
jgi:hypothetical protein